MWNAENASLQEIAQSQPPVAVCSQCQFHFYEAYETCIHFEDWFYQYDKTGMVFHCDRLKRLSCPKCYYSWTEAAQ